MSRFRPPTHVRAAALAPTYSSGREPLPPSPQAVRQAMPAPPDVRAVPQLSRFSLLIGIYLLMHVVPVAELMTKYVGVNLAPVLITAVFATLGALVSGYGLRFSQIGLAKPWLLLLGCFILASIAGDFPGLSVPFILEYAVRFHLMPFLICAAAVTSLHVRYIMSWVAGGCVIVLVLCGISGRADQGRFAIPDTSLSNPNDLAFILLFCATFLLLWLYLGGIRRIAAIFMLPVLLYVVLQTGSRANFLTLILLALAGLLVAPSRARKILLLAAPVAVLALILFSPASMWSRLTLISFAPRMSSATNLDEAGAVGSQMARTELQRKALGVIGSHPMLGVGPQMFANAVEDMVREQGGLKSTWQAAHNVYLQIAAENGVLAGLLFIATLLGTLKMNFQALQFYKRLPHRKLDEGQSFCLLLATITYSFGILFCNFVYEAYVPILLGLSAANYLAMRQTAAAQHA